jgi:glycosyltransferase involved in cell wall biosynthesis
MRQVRTPIRVILAGTGGATERLRAQIEKYGLGEKVALAGFVSEEMKQELYRNCLAVCFPPYQEDYGYVTLEAMLSGKPVITCSDSGGPLEFVEHDRTGWVVEPDPKRLARQLDHVYQHPEQAARMGADALRHYREMEITWDRVINKLLEPCA